MALLIKKLAGKSPVFNVIHSDQLWMASYALIGRTATGSGTALILDQHNAVFQIPERMADSQNNSVKRLLLKLEGRKLHQYECDMCERFDQVVWVTEEDRSALKNTSQGDKSSDAVIPIAIDLTEKQLIDRKADPHRVVFLGGLHWPPNAQGITWFVRRIWPEIFRSAPQSILTIIGKRPSRELLQMSDSRLGIEVTGYAPEMTPYLKETAAFIVPLLAGGGMRVKILDAWAWGLPVVSTRIGAEGLMTEEGENILLADDPKGLARAVVRVIRDGELASKLSLSGRRTVETHYDWREVYSAWDQVYSCASST
jgi:glycosyltransferase involved in cell wall biosynthesis